VLGALLLQLRHAQGAVGQAVAQAPSQPAQPGRPASDPIPPRREVARPSLARLEPQRSAPPAAKPAPTTPLPLPPPPVAATPPPPAIRLSTLAEQGRARAAEHRYGTSIDFVDSPTDAAEQAQKDSKLLFVLHVAGNFEKDCFT
jgi:hypothetical protein